MKNFMRFAAICFAIQFLVPVDPVFSQLPNARLQRVFPCGAKIGSQIEVSISGADLDEATELVFSNPRITGKVKMNPASDLGAATPIAGQFEVSVPADVQPGIYEVRAMGRFGLSTSRRFVISSTDELACNDQNKTTDKAMAISVEQAVSGRAVANGKHHYKFSLEKDEKVVIECQSKTIDSKMNPVLVITDLSGNEIARDRSSSKRNAAIFFKAPIASQYLISVRDAVFGGGADYFYRLSISKKPYLAACHPVVIQTDSNPTLNLIGWNLPGGKESEGFETLSVSAKDVLGNSEEGSMMPLGPSSYSLQWKTCALRHQGKAISNAVPVYLSPNPVTLENSSAEVTQISLPVEISGGFAPNNETDYYQFSGKKGETYFVDVFSHRLGSESDLILMIQQQAKDGSGNVVWKTVAVNDDPKSRGGGVGPDFSTSTDDPGLQFQIPADGIYRLSVKDQFGTYDYDPRSNYRIAVRKLTPNFFLVCHPVYGKLANGNQILGSALTLRREGRFNVKLSLHRKDGFSEPITIYAEGLPAGVECAPMTVSSRQATVDLVFSAGADAPTGRSLVRVYGKSTIDGKELIREAVYCCVTWDTGNKGQTPAFFRRASCLELSVMPHERAAASIQVGDGKTLETSIGGKIKLPVKLTRRHKFSDPLKLVALNLPGQLKPGDLTIAKDKVDGTIEVFVKDKNTPLGDYQFILKGDSKFKYSRNPEAAGREEKEHGRLDALLKEKTAAKTALTTELAAAKKTTPEIEKNVVLAQRKHDEAKKKTTEDEAKMKSLETAIREAKANTAKPTNPLIVEAAEAQLEILKSQLSQNAVLKQAEAGLQKATSAKMDLVNKMKAGQEELAALDASIKKIDAIKKAVKARLDSLKKQSAPKDLFYMTVSNPLHLRVVGSPIEIFAVAPQSAKVDSMASPTLKIQRKYGFAEAVNLAFKVPAGVEIKPVVIPKDKSELPIAINVSQSCKPGEHAIEVTATGKFNNVDIKTVSTFKLQVANPGTTEAKK